MKKTFLSIAILAIAVNLFAQDQTKTKNSRVYIRAGGVYAFPHAGQMSVDQTQFVNGKFDYTTTTTGSTTTTTYKWDVKKASFGAGITVVLAGGFMINNNIGIELAASVGISPKKYEYKETAPYVSAGVPVSNTLTAKYHQKTPVLIMPSVVIQTGGKKLNVYSRVGLALPVAGKFIMEYEEYKFITQASLLTNWTYEVKNKFAVGLQGALGAHVNLSDKIKVFVEVNGVSLNAYAKKSTMTKFTQNGTDYLSEIDMYDKEIEYAETGTRTSPNPNTNLPKQAATFSTAYSNIGFGAGLLILL